MSNFKLVQGIITQYVSPRVCNILQIPDHYPITNTRLPNVFNNQTRPLVGSLVLVASQDSFKSYVVCVLREPEEDFNPTIENAYTNDLQMRGAVEGGLQPGEVLLQANGTIGVDSGNNAFLYIGNSGTLQLEASSHSESIFIGGETTDDDEHTIIVRSPNFSAESFVHDTDLVQSSFSFDDVNTLRVGNDTVVPNTLVKTPLSELTMDYFGTITLRNTTAGADKGVLKIDTTSDILLKNNIGSFQIDPAGNISITGTTINLNSGTFGVARLNDTVTSNLTTDPTWWTFWQNLSTQIAALPTTPLDGGATLKAGLATLFALIPTTIISKITSSSTTVVAGD